MRDASDGRAGALGLWGPVVVVAGMVVYFSVVRRPVGGAELPLHVDKAGHFVAYGALSFLVARALGARGSLWTVAVAAGVWVCAFGGALEVVQPLFGRTADFLDMAANTAGAGAAAALWAALARARA